MGRFNVDFILRVIWSDNIRYGFIGLGVISSGFVSEHFWGSSFDSGATLEHIRRGALLHDIGKWESLIEFYKNQALLRTMNGKSWKDQLKQMLLG